MNTEINVFIKEQVTDVVQLSGDKAETVEVFSCAELHKIEHNLLRMRESLSCCRVIFPPPGTEMVQGRRVASQAQCLIRTSTGRSSILVVICAILVSESSGKWWTWKEDEVRSSSVPS